jgi:hypothetical protein
LKEGFENLREKLHADLANLRRLKLINVDRTIITKYIKNIYLNNELSKASTCAKITQVQKRKKTASYPRNKILEPI